MRESMKWHHHPHPHPHPPPPYSPSPEKENKEEVDDDDDDDDDDDEEEEEEEKEGEEEEEEGEEEEEEGGEEEGEEGGQEKHDKGVFVERAPSSAPYPLPAEVEEDGGHGYGGPLVVLANFSLATIAQPSAITMDGMMLPTVRPPLFAVDPRRKPLHDLIIKIAVLVMALGGALLLLSFIQERKTEGIRKSHEKMGDMKDASLPYAGAGYPISHQGQGAEEGDGLDGGDSGPYPDPTLVVLEEVKYAGSGCGPGAVKGVLSKDAKSLSPIPDDSDVKIIAKSGPGASLSDSRKNCHYSVVMTYPAGWSYALASAELEGSIDLDGGATGIEDVYYYFQGVGKNCAVPEISIDGPKKERFQTGNRTFEEPLCWSPCSNERSLQINVAARVRGRGVRGVLSIEKQKFFLKWRQCSAR
ncbi:hypothetical protein CBR_g38206 [Chara braunii]|uniref:Uncharacterized protein n=1 Tax=Chara braunii TaxID=69332 RepID=A0A388LPT0_CHABU|nr:hypothetical protein CBR_g38206 [Chara braunii]|eukprot:GBG84235.1 hypothetical protein CBR_g38206 [Chara braunii]